MASEKIGYACEIVTLAACRLPPCNATYDASFQNKGLGLKVAVPDIVLFAAGSEDIEAVIQVTYAGSKPDSQKKFWRNLGEVQEFKRKLGSSIRVAAVTFGTAYLNYIPPVYQEGWDGAVFANEISLDLVDLATSLSAREFDSIEDAIVYLHSLPNAKRKLQKLSEAIFEALQESEKSGLWVLHEAQSRPENSRDASPTSVRRGFAFLTLGKSPVSLTSTPVVVSASVGAALHEIGILRKRLGGTYSLAQEDAVGVISHFGRDKVELVLRDVPWARMAPWIDFAIESVNVVVEAEHWSACWRGLSRVKVFQKLSNAALSEHPHSEIFIALFELIRAALGRRQGLGAEQLLRIIEKAEADPNLQDQYGAVLGRKPVMRDHETIRLGLQSVFSPGGKQGFSLIEDDLVRVSFAIFDHFVHEIDAKLVKSKIEEVKSNTFDTYFEVKIATYRHFDPIQTLLISALSDAGIDYIEENVCSAFADAARHKGFSLDPRATNTRVIKTNQAVINWQSVTDDGRDHKRKELCGRAVALRYGFDVDLQQYIQREGVVHLFLVIDGSFRSEDLVLLSEAGWDEFFYPTELDQLIARLYQ